MRWACAGAMLLLSIAVAADAQPQHAAAAVDTHGIVQPVDDGATTAAESALPPRTQYADPQPYHRDAVTTGTARWKVVPLYEAVNAAKLMRYKTAADYPDYSRYYNGNGIEVAEGGEIPRSDYGIGIQTGRITGGGCFPTNPNDPNSPCLVETDASGNQRTIFKERERWVFRMSYIDPSVSGAAEVNIGFPGPFWFSPRGDDELVWVRATSGNRSCFTFYSYYCNTYGIDLNYIEGSVRAFEPDCTHKRGPGYKAQIFYQYSRYKITDEIPPGVDEWVPATIPATSTRLEQPGKLIWYRNWSLAISDYAVAFGVSGPLHPAVESDTGYATVAPTVAPAVGKVTMSTYDCGPIPGVSFSIATEFVPGSSGHAHTAPPALSDVATLSASSGTTDADGKWSTDVRTGRVASVLRLTATGTVEGKPFTRTANLSVGFNGLVDPGVDGSAIIRYTGNTGTVGSRHPNNHYGSGELHVFVRKMASYYNLLAADPDKGSIGINDMSLPRGGLFDLDGAWTPGNPGHYRHRFGTDADIDRFVQHSSGTFVFADQTVLQDVVETNLDGIFLPESGGRMHVQVPEFMVGDILLRGTR